MVANLIDETPSSVRVCVCVCFDAHALPLVDSQMQGEHGNLLTSFFYPTVPSIGFYVSFLAFIALARCFVYCFTNTNQHMEQNMKLY